MQARAISPPLRRARATPFDTCIPGFRASIRRPFPASSNSTIFWVRPNAWGPSAGLPDPDAVTPPACAPSSDLLGSRNGVGHAPGTVTTPSRASASLLSAANTVGRLASAVRKLASIAGMTALIAFVLTFRQLLSPAPASAAAAASHSATAAAAAADAALLLERSATGSSAGTAAARVLLRQQHRLLQHQQPHKQQQQHQQQRGALTHAASTQALPFASTSVAHRPDASWGSRTLQYARYKFLQLLTLPTWGKVVTVFAITAPIVVAGSLALHALTGDSLGAAAQRVYYILNNVPGCDVAGEPNPAALLLLNAVYVVGLLSFAVLIGLLGDDIRGAVEAARLGNFPVPERNHTVILGHNRQLRELLQQVAVARADRGAAAFPGQLVVLSERDKGDMDTWLVEELGPRAAADIVTRQGSPLKVADLQRVAAGHARTVIVMTPEGGEEEEEEAGALTLEAKQAVTLASLQQLRAAALAESGGGGGGGGGTAAKVSPSSSSYGADQIVVVQHDAALDLMAAATSAAGTASVKTHASRMVASVSRLNNLCRVEAQCAVQPGLSAVLVSLMQQQPGCPEFYVTHVPEAVGLTFGQARSLFPRAVLCGLHDPQAGEAAAAVAHERARAQGGSCSGEVAAAAHAAIVLNPLDSAPIRPDQSLVLLADSTKDTRPCRAALAKLAKEITLPQPSSFSFSPSTSTSSTSTSPADIATTDATASPATAARTDPKPISNAPHRRLWRFFFNRQPPPPESSSEDPIVAAAAAAATNELLRPRRIVVLSFSEEPPSLILEALADFCPAGSHAVVVTAEGSGGQVPRRVGPLRVGVLEANPRSRAALADADVAEADAIILAGLDNADADEADAQALATLLQLEAVLIHSGTSGYSHEDGPPAPINYVCRVTDPRTRDVIVGITAAAREGAGAAGRRLVTVEPINPDELLAGVLTQVAAEPRLTGLFHELSVVEGSEVYLHSPTALGLPLQQPISWAELQDTCRERDATALGLVRGGGGQQQQGANTHGGEYGRNVVLGVPPGGSGATVVLQPGDKVVVLAEDGHL